jgi:hypothetical protein
MGKERLHLALGLMVFVTTLDALAAPLEDAQIAPTCPVTSPPEDVFRPPAPYPQRPTHANYFWYGRGDLWTMLEKSGEWKRLPRNENGFRQKVFWWRPGFSGLTEPRPDLRVSGRRIDGEGAFTGHIATNARHEDFGGWAMLTGVDVPAPGCWELTGVYKDHRLSFVVWVQP